MALGICATLAADAYITKLNTLPVSEGTELTISMVDKTVLAILNMHWN
jgi:hypothetical protein